MYIKWPKSFKTVVGSIVVVGALKHWALLHSVYDLKARQMDIQHSLIWEFILFEFELSYNAAEASKNIWTKGQSAVAYSKVNR